MPKLSRFPFHRINFNPVITPSPHPHSVSKRERLRGPTSPTRRTPSHGPRSRRSSEDRRRHCTALQCTPRDVTDGTCLSSRRSPPRHHSLPTASQRRGTRGGAGSGGRGWGKVVKVTVALTARARNNIRVQAECNCVRAPALAVT